MTQDLIRGIIYSKFHTRLGPDAIAWTPTDIAKEVRDLVSMKSINILSGERGLVPESLAIFPFPSINLKGIIKSLEISDDSARGGAVDGSITLLFEEANDAIFYKYFKHFEKIFNEVAREIVALEEKGANKQQIEERVVQFYIDLIEILNELRDAEITSIEREAFRKEEQKEDIIKFKYKIIVVGDPAVGKTSTVLRFTDRAFKRSYLPTIGTNINEKDIQVKNKQIHFIIWDIAGQSKFQMMRKHFYSGADGQLLIFDLTRPNTLKNIASWYQDIKSYLKKDLAGFVLGNKSDLGDLRNVDDGEIKTLAKELNLEYIETSALSGENIDEAFQRLGELLYNPE